MYAEPVNPRSRPTVFAVRKIDGDPKLCTTSICTLIPASIQSRDTNAVSLIGLELPVSHVYWDILLDNASFPLTEMPMYQ